MIPKHPAFEYLIYAGQLLAGLVVALIGEWTLSLQILATMIGMDYVTGLLRAWMNPNVKMDSDIGIKGIVKKVGYFGLVIVFFQIGLYLSRSMEVALFFRKTLVGILIANESVSALENIARFDKEDSSYLPAAVISFAEQIVKQELNLPQGYHHDE